MSLGRSGALWVSLFAVLMVGCNSSGAQPEGAGTSTSQSGMAKSEPSGCSTDSECKGDRICVNHACQAAEPTKAAPQKPGDDMVHQLDSALSGAKASTGNGTAVTRRTDSYFCINGTRCAKGQRCCPGGATVCIPEDAMCEAGEGELESTIGFMCNRFTNEPCAADETCVFGKVGHGPLTVTADCQKK